MTRRGLKRRRAVGQSDQQHHRRGGAELHGFGCGLVVAGHCAATAMSSGGKNQYVRIEMGGLAVVRVQSKVHLQVART